MAPSDKFLFSSRALTSLCIYPQRNRAFSLPFWPMTMEIILSIHISTTLSCESLVLNIIKYEPHAFLLSLGLLQNLSLESSHCGLPFPLWIFISHFPSTLKLKLLTTMRKFLMIFNKINDGESFQLKSDEKKINLMKKKS